MNDEKDLVTKHLQYAQPQPVSARKAAPIAPAETLDELRVLVEGCTKCDLCETRTKIVFGSGNPHARILVIGEAPGKNEDLQGEPFVGAAGKFLNELLEDAGLKREDIFIANVLKCRPPANRNPQPHEIEACAPYLRAQNQDHQPPMSSSRLATSPRNSSCRTTVGITRLRGTVQQAGRFLVLPTFHPAAAIYDRSKRDVLISDFKQVGQIVRDRMAARSKEQESSAE